MAIEAMVAGRAIVYFEGTTVAEIMDAPRCGISVKYRSVSDMRANMEHLIKDRDEICFRGLMGRPIVEEKFSYERYPK